MNGKSRRSGMKCFYQRGMPKQTAIKSITDIKKPNLFSIIFQKSLKTLANIEQNQLLSYFESYPTVNPKVAESFSYNANTEYAVVKLVQSDFNNGTVRIRKPGIYQLGENIIFHPNPDNDFLPTTDQSTLYPRGMNGPYHLGFFAAITVEAPDVIIDLNGFTIKQSTLHNLQQRFYAHIEVANSPFIPGQGPHSFTDDYVAANRLLITGGTLGVSSHHGVHGNTANNVVIYNVVMNEFEVAGVALNGTTLGVLGSLTLNGITKAIRVLSSYPQALFLKRKLKALKESSNPTETLNVNSSDVKNFTQAIADLENDLDNAKTSVVSGETPSNFMGNQTGKYDGNMYGIVLNVNGIVIHDFLQERTDSAIGNENILVHSVSMDNIETHPVEIIALDRTAASTGAYGSGRQVGPFGDVFDVRELTTITDDKYVYTGNSLGNGQLLLAKHKINNPSASAGTVNLEAETIAWAESASGDATADLNQILVPTGSRSLVANGDSMGHLMKGNIGLFISGGINIRVDNCTIQNVITRGTDVGNTDLTNNGTAPDPQYFKGGDSVGIAITASTTVNITNTTISNILTENPNSSQTDVLQLTGNSDIQIS